MTRSYRRLFTALSGSVALAIGGGLAAPVQAAPPADPPVVQAIALQSSQTKVTSSTGKALFVRVRASQTPSQVQGQPSTGQVAVALSTGTSSRSETHEWTFPVDGSALTVTANGGGTLNVPNANIAPFGTVNLKFKPIGDPTTESCQSKPKSQAQKVSLDGTVFFDSQSKKWGTVGEPAGKLTFADTNTVTTTYVNTNPSCFNFTPPCAAGLFWHSGNEAKGLDGASRSRKGLIVGSRTTELTTPAGANRLDEIFGTTKQLVLQRDGKAATLLLKSADNATGSAKLKASKHGKPFSTDCTKGGKSKVQTTTRWNNAKYKNGTKPLVVHAQVFGRIKVANNGAAELIKTVLVS